MTRKKTIKEIIETPVSRETLRDLKDILFTEIPLPFSGGGKSAEEKLQEYLAFSDEAKNLDKVLAELAERGRAIGEILVDKGVVARDDLPAVAEEQARHKIAWAQALVNLGFVSSSNIQNVEQVLRRELEEKEKGKSLEHLLVSEDYLSRERIAELKRLAKERQKSLTQVVLEEGALPGKRLGELYEKHYGIDWIDISEVDIDPYAVRMIPDHIMAEHGLIGFHQSGHTLKVAMADPRDENVRDRLQILSGRTITPYLADGTAIVGVQRRYLIDMSPPAVEKKKPGAAAEKTPAAEAPRPASQAPAEDLSGDENVVRTVTQVLASAIRSRATDIHFEPQGNHLRIRFRVDGMLHDFMTLPDNLAGPAVSRLKILANMDITERRRPQDGRMTCTIEDRIFNFRAATLPTSRGEKLALRVLPEASRMMGLAGLGLEKKDLALIERALARTAGMILVTGPIGSGKTTTLYNMLQTKNSKSANVVTIEDPIEYELPGVNQIGVDLRIGLDFATGLRAVLRQDADVLMVGEIRDSETAATAVRAAMTGHLLFSTLHTPDAVGAVYALQHLGVPPFLIGNALVSVIAQRLVRRVCSECHRMVTPGAGVREEMGLHKNSRKKVPEAVGCEHCFRTGYQGRVGVYDVMPMTAALRDAVSAGESEAQVRALADKEGSGGLWAAGWRKVQAGLTTPEEVVRVLFTE